MAFADVADERRAAGDTELLWIPHRDEPIAEDFDNTIGWDEMRRCLHGEVLPPRPGDGIPQYGLTSKIRVLTFSQLALGRLSEVAWPKLGITKVTGGGWPCWLPVREDDRERVFASETRRREEEKLRQKAARRKARENARHKTGLR